MTIRVAVVGVGGMGACHAHHIAELSGAEVSWVADPDETAGRALAHEVGSTWLADGFEAISVADAVVIASPDRFHFGYVEAALDRDLPILCEKPLTVDLAEAESLVKREAEAGKRNIMVGFMREYDEPHVLLREALADLGAVHHLRCVHRNTNDLPRALAEVLVQSVIHDLHTVRFVSGAEIVSVATSTVETERGLRFVLLTCQLSNGGVATIEFDDAAAGYEVMVEANAERGNVMTPLPLRATLRATGQISSMIGDDWFAPFLGTYRVEMRAWLDSIEAGEIVGPSTWDGYAAQAVVEAAVRSAAKGGAPEAVNLGAKPALFGP